MAVRRNGRKEGRTGAEDPAGSQGEDVKGVAEQDNRGGLCARVRQPADRSARPCMSAAPEGAPQYRGILVVVLVQERVEEADADEQRGVLAHEVVAAVVARAGARLRCAGDRSAA